jgi:hypothetical protein
MPSDPRPGLDALQTPSVRLVQAHLADPVIDRAGAVTAIAVGGFVRKHLTHVPRDPSGETAGR